MSELFSIFPGYGNIGLLVASSLAGTLFAYFQIWAWSPKQSGGLVKFLFGDARAIGRAITKLVGALSVAFTTDMVVGMNTTAIIAMGIGIGLATPSQVEKQEEENRNESNSGNATVVVQGSSDRD